MSNHKLVNTNTSLNYTPCKECGNGKKYPLADGLTMCCLPEKLDADGHYPIFSEWWTCESAEVKANVWKE